jgi:hypothetical protein
VLLAMDANIHAALVGGVVAGSVVVLGIGLTEWLQRRRENWRELRAAVQEISVSLAIVLALLSEHPPSFVKPPGTALGTPGWEHKDRLTRAMFDADRVTRRFRFRRRREVRRQLDALLAKVSAADYRFHRGTAQLTTEDMYEIMDFDLSTLVLGRRPLIGQAMQNYIDHGFS